MMRIEFPRLATDDPELERLWAMSRIEELETLDEDHFRRDELGLADGCNEDFGLACDLRQVGCAAVAHRDRGVGGRRSDGRVGLGEHRSQRLAHELAAAHHHDGPACDLNAATM